MECLGAILASVVAETCRGMCSRAETTMFRSNTKTLNRELERLKKVRSKVHEDLNKLGNQEKSFKQKIMIWLRKVEENVSIGEMILEKRSSCAILVSDKSVAVLEEIKRLEEQGHELLIETYRGRVIYRKSRTGLRTFISSSNNSTRETGYDKG
ncbi:unnamed protein product [Brassica oleracea]